MGKEEVFYATGKRKSSVARTWLKPGTGNILINDQPIDKYVSNKTAKYIMLSPLTMTDKLTIFNLKIRVHGGGVMGQAGAIRHGITKALIEAQPELKNVLRKAGFVTRDARIKERKKYGQKGARGRFQFSKR
ncbi:MAG: 30S ribosomal protein S9 [Desulfobacterales bacterium]|nr:30S ribosomal protein S9 [Desulfobacterales bacterium]